MLKDFDDVEPRAEPLDATSTYEAVVFKVKNARIANKIRQELLEEGVGTKILPEATSWHFAGLWEHIDDKSSFRQSQQCKEAHEMLMRSVSIPINIFQDGNLVKKVKSAILNCRSNNS